MLRLEGDFVLGLKVLTYRKAANGDLFPAGFYSPSYQTWWSPDGLKATHPTKYLTSLAHPEESPGYACRCGIYAATSPEYAREYYNLARDRALFLVAGLPRIILAENGWRAAEAKVVAVVWLPHQPDYDHYPILGIGDLHPDSLDIYNVALRPRIPPQNMIGDIGCSYFDVEPIPFEVAMEALHYQNQRYM